MRSQATQQVLAASCTLQHEDNIIIFLSGKIYDKFKVCMLQTGVFLNDRLRSVGIKVVGFFFILQMRRLRLKNTIDAVGVTKA